jgi:hypothetical protein
MRDMQFYVYTQATYNQGQPNISQHLEDIQCPEYVNVKGVDRQTCEDYIRNKSGKTKFRTKNNNT